MRRALLVVAALSAGPGCDCGKKSAKPASGSAAPSRDLPATARNPGPRPARELPTKPDVRRTAPITVEEAQAAMPPLEGARPMGAPAVAPSGAQARTSYCVDADNIGVAGEAVSAQLQAAGWAHLTARPPVADVEPKQFVIAGEKGALRMTTTIAAVRRTGCDATVNQFFTVVAIQKIASGEPSSPTSP